MTNDFRCTMEEQAKAFYKFGLPLLLDKLYTQMRNKKGKAKAVARVQFLKIKNKAR